MPRGSHLGDDVKRVPLNLPMNEYTPLLKAAEARHITITDMLRRCIKVGLLVDSNPDKMVFIRDGDDEKHVVLL